ncbi:cuticle protein AMP4-like [Penaeus monodon]|uniref:cuticle protein AMP4-like n=1 Tax=Penaeus monodon TaxID=6687 RepID=UPI0018A74DD3|nr:cuticle protein AMP4-like [Penaeus monodon]
MKIIVFACLAAVAVAAPQLEERVVELLRDERVANGGAPSPMPGSRQGHNTAVSGRWAEGQINQGDPTRDGTKAFHFRGPTKRFQPSDILPTPHPLPAHVYELLEIAERQRAEGIVFE